jgi:hypothetical protein
MLNYPQITEIAGKAVRKVADADIERIVTGPATDSQGNDALRITLVFKLDGARKLTGDQALDMLVNIQKLLRAKGEDRLPMIQYTTEDELDSEEDHEGLVDESDA